DGHCGDRRRSALECRALFAPADPRRTPGEPRRLERDRSSELVTLMKLSNYAVEQAGARVARPGRSPRRSAAGGCRWDLMNEQSAKYTRPGSMPSTPAIWSACSL